MMKALIQMEDTKATEGRVLSKNGSGSSSMSQNEWVPWRQNESLNS